MLSPFLIPFSILSRRPGLVFLFLDDFCLVDLVDTLLDLRLDAWLVLLVVVSEVKLGMLVIVDSFDFVDFFELFDAWVVSSECGVFAVSVDRGVLVLLGPRVSLVTVDLDPPLETGVVMVLPTWGSLVRAAARSISTCFSYSVAQRR